MKIESIIKTRGISRVLHFTTSNGLLGILAKQAIMSRKQLTQEQYLEHIFKPNCAIRSDPQWVDYINLSIQNINEMFFSYSTKWHSDVFWCILSLDPMILTHKGVWFVTTNNSYGTAQRGQGVDGLESLYAPAVLEKPPYKKTRTPGMNSAYTTSPQAEVLYPNPLDIKYLSEIFVADEAEAEIVQGQMGVFHTNVTLSTQPQMFI